jgi:hypothetical protein
VGLAALFSGGLGAAAFRVPTSTAPGTTPHVINVPESNEIKPGLLHHKFYLDQSQLAAVRSVRWKVNPANATLVGQDCQARIHSPQFLGTLTAHNNEW